MVRTRCLPSALAVLGFVAVAHAADWPQWLGPERTGVSKETGLLKDWPKDGPKLKWKITNLGGEGYSSPAIAKGRIYTLAQYDNTEHVVALYERDGSKIWSTKIGKVGPNKGPQYLGPRSTPTVDGDRLYTLGSDGDLACVELTKGDIVWHKNLARDFEGQVGLWAYSESPLVDGNVVVVSPGGKSATVVALNKKDGAVVWKSMVPEADYAAYGSPIRIEAGGVNVNNAMTHVFQFPLPMGGWKESGLGYRMGGPDGIRKYCRKQAFVSEKVNLKTEMHWYPYSARKARLTGKVLRLIEMHDWRRRLGRKPKGK